ncbi:MAG: AMP-binding protein, partial [Myxococcales bacterium]|nr:AMP-binding protein [Myxococcales bacterium]
MASNSTASAAERGTFVHILRAEAERRPDEIAYNYLFRSVEEVTTITYGELDARARAVGARLIAEGLSGTPILLLYPPDIEFIVGFFGCLYAGAYAVPAYPPDPARLGRTLPRLQSIVRDAGCQAVLTTRPIASMAASLGKVAGELLALKWITSDAEVGAVADDWADPGIKPDDLAFLQYTSGSTSTPKGVEVTHRNLTMHQDCIHDRLESEQPGNMMVSWLPTYHDMGLIGGLLHPLGSGFGCVFMPPMSFLRKPFLWLQAISHFRGALTVAPDFAYELCVRKVSPAERDTLDLRCLRRAMSGAEPVRYQTMKAFTEHFAPAGFNWNAWFPTYGMAEATLMVTGGHVSAPPRVRLLDSEALEQGQIINAEEVAGSDKRSQHLIGCGHAVNGLEIAIVDPESGRRAAADRVGEIWLRGPTIARGYWNRPEATEEIFHARIAGDEDEREWMRTGDLGFLDGEELYLAGRLKDLIILAGRNYYPQDLEETAARTDPALRPGCTVACTVAFEGRELPFLVQEVDTRRPVDTHALIGRIRRRISEAHEVPMHGVVLIAARSIHKTSSGKIQRRRTRMALEALELEVVDASLLEPEMPSTAPLATYVRALPEDARPEAIRYGLASLIAEARGAGAAIDDRKLSAQGLHFEHVVRLFRLVQARFGVALPWGLLLGNPTPERLIGTLTTALAAPPAEAETEAPAATLGRTEADLTAWLVERVSMRTGTPVAELDPHRPFAELGLDSADAVELSSELEEWLGRTLPSTVLWDHGTVASLVDFLVHGDEAPTAMGPARSDEPVAVVGMALRLPGAATPDAFWSLLREGRSGIRPAPAERYVPEAYAHLLPEGVSVDMIRRAGFIDDVDGFDASLFGITGREAPRIDPQQRLLLEMAWEALESAGLSREAVAGSSTGVFVGMSSDDYSSYQFADAREMRIHTCTGNARSIASNRLSYYFDLHGPSETIDTACSSSLVAVHLAVRALQRGDCDLALAGGVNGLLEAEAFLAMCGLHMLAPDGRCKSFDARADGFARGEGCGMLVLARLPDAKARGLRIRAVIHGSAVNQDGRSAGLTAPNRAAQVMAQRAALADAGLPPAAVSYIETHGTGTSLGDPIEVGAITDVFGADRAAHDSLWLGAVKTNIGHLESASGVAGLIKGVLAIEHGAIPANLHLETPSPHIAWAELPVRLPRRLEPWNPPGPRVFGLNSFGFAGTNAHLIIGEAPAEAAPPRHPHAAQILPLSARAPGLLPGLAEAYAARLAEGADLADLAFTAAIGRDAHAARLTV